MACSTFHSLLTLDKQAVNIQADPAVGLHQHNFAQDMISFRQDLRYRYECLARTRDVELDRRLGDVLRVKIDQVPFLKAAGLEPKRRRHAAPQGDRNPNQS